MKAMPAPTKPFRGLPKRLLADHFVEPEYTIPTDDAFTNDLDDQIHTLKYDPRIHVEGVKQWVNKTRPVRQPFDGEAAAVDALSDTLPVHCDSAPSVSAADTDPLEEQWRQREFERAYAQLAHRYELHAAQPTKVEARRIHDKVARYRRAFLKGFYEARIRRVEANKWLYERLHVNADHIKEKYRQLVYASEPHYVVELPDAQVAAAPGAEPTGGAAAALAPNAAPHAGDPQPPNEADKDDAQGPSERTCDKDVDELDELEADAASVHSFAPERDAILLQDINSPPHIRGFGRDLYRKYDPKLRLLHLEHWMSPDIEQWMNERRLNADASSEAASEYAYRHHHRYDDEEESVKPPKDDLKYEEIRGATELPTWLGPKKLDEQELDLENFRKPSVGDNEARSLAKDEIEERKAPAADGNERADDAASEASKAISDTPSQGLLRQLVQSQSKDYYKLWYATHDTYNTTPFLEARLQRLMREIFGRREWTVYCDYLKEKQHEKNKRMHDAGQQQ